MFVCFVYQQSVYPHCLGRDVVMLAAARQATKSGTAHMSVAAPRNFISVVLGTMTFGWNQASATCDDEKSAAMTKSFLESHPDHTEIDTAYLVRIKKKTDVFVRLRHVIVRFCDRFVVFRR